MDESAVSTATPDRDAVPRGGARTDLGLLALLLLLAASSRLWLLGHTEVAARDSIGYIRYALQLEQRPWPGVLKESLQHPGYPAAVLAVSYPVRHFLVASPADIWQFSAQLASALAGILLILPMYFLGRELFDRRVGFWASALFQCLPTSSRIMSDALSEATYLLCAAVALLWAVQTLRTRSVLRAALCGLFIGLAYLTRPEGFLILPAALLVLVAAQLVPGWRRPWGRTLACGVTLTAAAVLVGGPYVAVIHHLTNKPTPLQMIKTTQADAPSEANTRPEPPGLGRPVPGTVLAWWALDWQKGSVLWGFRALNAEVIKGFYYVAWLPALLALWWFRARLWAVPGAWVLLALCLFHSLVLWRLAVVMGYLSERHVQLLVMCGVFWAAAGLALAGEWLVVLGRRLRPSWVWLAPERRWPARILLIILATAGLVEGLRPLHANRVGHHAAGRWLAEHTLQADPVIDPFCWASYYAGRLFWENRPPPVPPGYHPTRYVVVEGSSSETPHYRPRRLLAALFACDAAPERPEPDHNDHARLPLMAQALSLAKGGQLVYYWPEQVPADNAKVKIYAVPMQ
jgi:hypothetical protein